MRARAILLSGLAGMVAAGGASAAPHERGYDAHVVAITCTWQRYDARQPWAKTRPGSLSATGVVVDGERILVEAQVVTDSTMIRVQKNGDAGLFAASIDRIDVDVNLALLRVDSAGFFDDLAAVELVPRPVVQGRVSSVRWNGRQLEVADGRISRAEVRESDTGFVDHVTLDVTTDMENGGWSTPVFLGERLLGLTVYQNDQTARVVPAEVLGAFLENAAGDRYFASFGMYWQLNRDPALAAYLGVEGDPRGIVVREVAAGTTGAGVLLPRDVLLSIDGKEIDADGFYRHPVYGQLSYSNIVSDGHAAGDLVPVRVLRGGAELELEMRLRRAPTSLFLIPNSRSDRAPPYLVAGGLVFRELDLDYLASFGNEWSSRANPRLVARWELERRSQRPDRRRIIVLTHVLPDPFSIGYHDLRDLTVKSVNGRAIDSIIDLKGAFDHPVDGFHTVELDPNLERSEVVLDAETLDDATARVLENYGIPAAHHLPDEALPALE